MMGGLRLRLAEERDLPEILAASSQIGWEHLTPHDRLRTSLPMVAERVSQMIVQALSMPGGICLVAEDGKRLAAYELLMVQEDPISGVPEALKLDGWVAPQWRGKGLNYIMHKAGEAHCQRQGIERMTCVVAAHNQASRRATEKSGFATERLLRSKWLSPPDDPSDGILLPGGYIR